MEIHVNLDLAIEILLPVILALIYIFGSIAFLSIIVNKHFFDNDELFVSFFITLGLLAIGFLVIVYITMLFDVIFIESGIITFG